MAKKDRNANRFETFGSGRPLKKTKFSFTESTINHLHTSTLPAFVNSSPVASQEPPPPPDFDNFLDWQTSNLPENDPAPLEEGGKVKVKRKAKRYDDSDTPLLTWKEKHRDSYLDGMLSTEGRGRLHHGSCRCGSIHPNYRCLDCFGLQMSCKTCMLEDHARNPLHRVQEWRSGYFHTASLKDLGLLLQLGHSYRDSCPSPKPVQGDFVVLDVTGIHQADVWFCGCEGAPEPYQQLLELGWWPSSYKEPRSAASFNLLRFFHVNNLQGQIPPTDFYRALEQITDGTGLNTPPERLFQFRLMVRQWRHIKSGKRFGRAHDPTGLAGTQPGGLTVLCRACPQPNVNLPEGWEKVPLDRSWLYGLTVAVDANFKQKSRARGNDERDPAMAPGTGCTVDHERYMAILNQKQHQDEISHCVGFNAIWNANNKKSKGLRATGIGSVTCARHELFRPNGVGDLQKGERYANMDLILLMSMLNCVLMMLFISYDIACQWFKNFLERMHEMPAYLHLPKYTTLHFKVPKFHLPAHVPSCFAPFSFNFTKGVGKVDGEGIERQWSLLNPVARSLSMMSAGGRSDTLDDFCNFLNWRKTIGLESSLLKKLVKAIPEAIIHTRAFSAFDEGLRTRYGGKIDEWEHQVLEWEKDRKKFCPYDRPERVITIAKVKKRLAEEDHKREIKGENAKQTTASVMIIEGLEIEDVQRQLSQSAASKKLTIVQETNLLTRRTSLLNRIRRFHQTQLIHIPALASHMPAFTDNESENPESIKVLLPSRLSAEARAVVCSKEIIDLEDQLRYAQAHEALGNITDLLCARSIAYRNSSRVMPSQGVYTKTRSLRDQVEAKIMANRERYCLAREALLMLRGPGNWERVLQVLKPEDVRGINERLLRDEEKAIFRDDQLQAGVSLSQINELLHGKDKNIATIKDDSVLAKNTSPSWVWFFSKEEGKDGDEAKQVEASLRVEWCKARARAQRSKEELELLSEEMRRAVAFCNWRSKWWTEQIGKRKEVSPWLAEGLQAYAMEQADIESERSASWAATWHPLRQHVATIVDLLDSGADVDSVLAQLSTLTVELDLDTESEIQFEP